MGEGFMCDLSLNINFRKEFHRGIFGFQEILKLSLKEPQIPGGFNMFQKTPKKRMVNGEFEIKKEEEKTPWILAPMNPSKGTQGKNLKGPGNPPFETMGSMAKGFGSNFSPGT
jgi:hypothetical protein